MSRNRSQWWADKVTEFSGSWPFIIWFTIFGTIWVLLNISRLLVFDPYPFLFLNWVLTVISTLQTPLIMLSQNRQNEVDRERVQEDRERLRDIMQRLDEIAAAVDVRKGSVA